MLVYSFLSGRFRANNSYLIVIWPVKHCTERVNLFSCRTFTHRFPHDWLNLSIWFCHWWWMTFMWLDLADTKLDLLSDQHCIFFVSFMCVSVYKLCPMDWWRAQWHFLLYDYCNSLIVRSVKTNNVSFKPVIITGCICLRIYLHCFCI